MESAQSSVEFRQALVEPIALPSLSRPELTFEQQKEFWRHSLSMQIYGPLPDAPIASSVEREPLSGSGVSRLILNLTLPNGRWTVDAALWVPDSYRLRGLICGLDFNGPAGILPDEEFPLDLQAFILPQPAFGCDEGRLKDELRGTSALSWPVSLLTAAGYGVLVSCYGSWVPDQCELAEQQGIKPLTDTASGAISIWAWAISRLIDAAETLSDITTCRFIVAGHSRLGKAALWAAANDARISAVFANNSGAAGAAPAAHLTGETLGQLHARFPHWLKEDFQLNCVTVDQHQLLALLHPRAVYLAAAKNDLWADPLGSYVALQTASELWGDNPYQNWPDPFDIWQTQPCVIRGELGYHLRSGAHGLLPYDWQRFLAFLSTLQ